MTDLPYEALIRSYLSEQLDDANRLLKLAARIAHDSVAAKAVREEADRIGDEVDHVLAAAQRFATSGALFPATELAEERCQSVSIFRERCALVPGHDGRHAANGCAWGYPPAPAEPAEEETKAEALTTFLEGVLDYDSADMGWHLPGDWDPTDLADAIVHAPTSSPVVPAPTETGPWPTWQEVPNDTPFWSRDKRETNSWWWIKRTTEHRKELRQADPCGETVHLGPTSFMNEFAPFVAAEEG